MLIVDDNLLTSSALVEQLRRAGHETIVAGTASQALQPTRRPPDVVLVNLTARAFHPPALVQEFRARSALRDSQIIGFCGHLETALRAAALEAGCDQVITNAQALRQLNHTLAQLRAR